MRGGEIVAPPVGSLPLPRWARGPLSLSYRPGTPAYRLMSKTRNKTYCHISYNSRSHLPTPESSSTATCPTASVPASLLERAPMLPCVPLHRSSPPCSGGGASVLPRAPWLRTLPPFSGRLRHYHVPCSFGPRLPAQEGYDATTCLMDVCGPHTPRIKKDIATLVIRLGSRVSKARPHISETPNTWPIMTCKTCGHAATMRRRPS
jgi:hypothetical protein